MATGPNPVAVNPVTGELTYSLSAPSVTVTGLTGAANQGRFVGVTATGAPTSGTFQVGDFIVTQNGQMFVCVTAGTPGTWVNPRELSDLLASGEETFARGTMNSTAGIAPVSGSMRFSYFTSRKSETTTQVKVYVGGTAAGATPTVCRIGLYTVAASGDLTLVASTANDTALFNSSGAVTKAWSSSYAKVSGTRYAVGLVVVSGATMPTFSGSVIGQGVEALVAPALSSSLAGQTDLPSSVAAGSLGNTGQRLYAAILP